MAIRLPGILARQNSRQSTKSSNVTKGFVVYVGENERKRRLIPVSYLNQPSFQDLFSKAAEEFGFDHPMEGLTIPCSEDDFIAVTSSLDV